MASLLCRVGEARIGDAMRLILIACAAMLSGCASLEGLLDNRVSCTLDGKQALYSSMYGPIGVTSKVSDSDSGVICKR